MYASRTNSNESNERREGGIQQRDIVGCRGFYDHESVSSVEFLFPLNILRGEGDGARRKPCGWLMLWLAR